MRKYCKTVTDKKGETKIHEVTITTPPPPEVHVNLCDGEGFKVKEEFLINNTNMGLQVMVLDICAPVRLAGIHGLE